MRRGTSRSDSWRRSFPKHWPQNDAIIGWQWAHRPACHQQLYELVSHTHYSNCQPSICLQIPTSGNYRKLQSGETSSRSTDSCQWHAERAVAIMQEYNTTLTKDEKDLKFLLQVIANHCQLYSTANKIELMQSWLTADTENFNKVILLGHITVLHMYMRSIVIDWVAWSVGLLQWWALQKWLSRSRCCFRLKTQLAQETMY